MWDEEYSVVFSGGGALGAWEVGCLQKLQERFQGRLPNIVTGASAGALNAAGVAAGLTAEQLEKEWQKLRPHNVFTERVDVEQLAKKLWWQGTKSLVPGRKSPGKEELLGIVDQELEGQRGFFDLSPFKQTMQNILRYQEGEFMKSPVSLAISCTNISESYPEHFYKLPPGTPLTYTEPANSKTRWTEIEGLPTLIQALTGSIAIPGLFPPMENRFDGGVLLNQPLKPAIDIGARNVFVLIPAPIEFGLTETFSDIFSSLLSTWLSTSLLAQVKATSARNQFARQLGEEHKIVRLCIVRPSTNLSVEPGVCLLDFGDHVDHLVRSGRQACEDRLDPSRFDPQNHLTWDA